MNSHKERIKTITGKNHSLPRQYQRSSSLHHSRQSNITDNERKEKPEHAYSDDEISSNGGRSPVYINVEKEDQVDHSESPSYPELQDTRKTKSMDRLPANSQSRLHTLKSNGSRPYITMNNNNNHIYGSNIYKSQSLRALKAAEPSKVLMKSSIQQENHDKAVQRYFRGLTFGKARKPCQIATAMFVLFVVFFIIGLVIIGLTYLYQNIMPTLDIGVGIGPSFLACSFIFLGVGIKFLYDSHKLSRRERRRIIFKGHGQRHAGAKKNVNPQIANEHIVSGSKSTQGVTRIPNRIKSKAPENQTLIRSSQSKMNTTTDKSSNV